MNNAIKHAEKAVCLKIEIHEIHKIYEIHMPKYRNPPTKYEIHCLKIEIHKSHEIHSKATLAKYRFLGSGFRTFCGFRFLGRPLKRWPVYYSVTTYPLNLKSLSQLVTWI